MTAPLPKTALAIAVGMTTAALLATPAAANNQAQAHPQAQAPRAAIPNASAAHAAAPGRAAPSAAERAARVAGGHVVHEIDGKTIVVRGPAAAAQAAALVTGATPVVAGNGPVRLRGAVEDAAIAALTADQRSQLQQVLGGVRDAAASAGEDAIFAPVPSGRARASSMMMRSSAATSSAVMSSAAMTTSSSTSAATSAAATSAPALPGTEHEPGFYDTSEYLYGRIAVNVVFVQGTDGRDWSDDDKSDAVSDLVEGLDMWAQEFPQASLSFQYRTFSTYTDHQPIEESSDNRAIWIEQGMEQIGFGRHDASDGWMQHYDNVYELDNDARNAFGTDWAFTVFMVRAADGIGDAWNALWNGTNGIFTFADGKPAFTMVGGPYTVMPYSKIWGVHFWNVAILTHEFGHIFYALDEYPAYAALGHDASERSGYFHVQNGNLQGPGAITDDGCIMRGSFKAVMDYVLDHIVSIFTFGATSSWDYNVCGFTQGQLGILDANGNGRPDVFDAAPGMTMPQSGVNTSWNVVWAFFDVEVGATPNQNDYVSRIHPASAKHDVAIDQVTGVWVSVDGRPWEQMYLNQNPPCGQGFLIVRPAIANQYWQWIYVYVSTASGNSGMQLFWVHP
jgi:hypothetical protein